MNDLPTSAVPNSMIPQRPQKVGGGGLHKEIEVLPGQTESPVAPEYGRDQELSPDVAAAGVRIHPTSIPVPPPIASMGVAPAGANVAMPAPAVKMPLTDDQIAQGLKQSITSSWRWLSEWCVRRLKQFHLKLMSVGGKVVEVHE